MRREKEKKKKGKERKTIIWCSIRKRELKVVKKKKKLLKKVEHESIYIWMSVWKIKIIYEREWKVKIYNRKKNKKEEEYKMLKCKTVQWKYCRIESYGLNI